MAYRDLSLGTKIGTGFALVLTLTILVGLTGYYALSRVVQDSTISQSIAGTQALFAKARQDEKDFLLHNHAEGRDRQAEAWERLTAHLQQSAGSLDDLSAQKGMDATFKTMIAEARTRIDGFKKACEGFKASEEAKGGLSVKILANISTAVKEIGEVQYWTEELLPASKFALAHSESYFDRQTDKRRQTVEKSFTQFSKALDDWYTRIERSDKLRAAGDKLKQNVSATYQMLRQFHDEVAQQDQFQSRMKANEDALEKQFEQLGKQMLKKMKGVETISNRLIFSAIAASLLLGGVFAFFAVRAIVKQIKTVSKALKDIAQGEGDLTRRLPVNSKDEVGQLAQWFNQFLEKMRLIIVDIAGNAGTLNQSSENLLNLSGRIASASKEMAEQSRTVSSSANEMSGQMSAITDTSNSATEKMRMVAAATEEMSATINEVARNTENSRTITTRAVAQSQSASQQVDELGRAAQEISQITEVITEISEQTNLLALNATIEAARAGDAGKGFAVVANEIKELARQTATATGKIKQQIDGIQNSTQDTVTGIQNILTTISEVNDIVNGIANSVEEQSIATKEIAGNVDQAAAGMDHINESVAKSSTVAGTIAAEIVRIDHTIADMTNESGQAQVDADALMRMAETLKGLVGRFKI